MCNAKPQKTVLQQAEIVIKLLKDIFLSYGLKKLPQFGINYNKN